MLKTILVLPDGTEISSGAGTHNAIVSCSYTQCVNAGTELTLGSVCAGMVELKLFTPGGGLTVSAGDRLTVYKEDALGARRKLGIFIAEKPERPSASTLRITAYDSVSLLDKDLTAWLARRRWPCALMELAKDVCTACGLTLLNTQLPNGSYLVPEFSAQGITGRQLMQWIGEVSGRFCRATADGRLEFAWYEPAPGITVGPTAQACGGSTDVSYRGGRLTLADEAVTAAGSGAVTVTAGDWTAWAAENGLAHLTVGGGTGQPFYYQGSLTCADYATAPIGKVQLRSSDADVGVIWPDTAGAVNTYRITGNPLLTGGEAALLSVAQALYSQLQGVSYTPCTLTVPVNLDLWAGHILPVTDAQGKTVTAYVMTKKQTGQRDTLSCTGSHSRDSVSAVNQQSYRALSGKVLTLRTDVEGIKAENKAADGRLASLALTVDGIGTTVSQQAQDAKQLRTDLSKVEQTARAVNLSVQTILEEGASKVRTSTDYTFDEEGLKIAKTGAQVENLLDNTGMYVTRSGQTLLQANSDGVVATDVQVRNFLCLGENSRLEDYETGRTACFWTGG